jgi:regulator of ribonuclease activity A
VCARERACDPRKTLCHRLHGCSPSAGENVINVAAALEISRTALRANATARRLAAEVLYAPSSLDTNGIAMTSFATCDLCDAHEEDTSGAFRVLPPVFRDFGGTAAFCGKVATLRCLEDNSRVREAVNSPGDGRVLVIDGGASTRRALVGGNLAAAAAKNGWAGIVVNGAVRDAAELLAAGIGIKALALMPLRSVKRDEGQRDLAIEIQGVAVRPGDWLYADPDGIVVSATSLI